jgi:DNA transformation protein
MDAELLVMDRDFLIDLFAGFGPVTIRRMFSGFGISADSINFGLALRGGLYLRADDQTIPRFEAEGCQPFQYQTRAKTVTVGSYWQLPERLYDDPEELTDWARASLAAAQRAALKKGAKKKSGGRKAAKALPDKTPGKKTIAKRAATKKAVAKKAGVKKKTVAKKKRAAKKSKSSSLRNGFAVIAGGASSCEPRRMTCAGACKHI